MVELTLVEVAERIKACLRILYATDAELFKRNRNEAVSEWCLAFRLAMYLQEAFSDYFVDHDFNSDITAGVASSGKHLIEGERGKFVDIIIHKRIATGNIVCIEVKKWNNTSECDSENDVRKLKALTKNHGYGHGFHLILGKTREQTKWTIYEEGEIAVDNVLVFGNEVTH